ncbi:hypothetical protein DPMN_032831 [Dreissena polymorpha]|uniref:Uncharacterized protein n=1 Tax=Dreissena polymorpha TaxID=45954 RepID=A0A9D4M4Y3_DREPO|nr:hypothetical protein DPMN_032831 [Dreissena polymorpha]
MEETALKTYLRLIWRTCNCAHFDTKICPGLHGTMLLLKGAYTTRTHEDPDIQILLDNAKDLYSNNASR